MLRAQGLNSLQYEFPIYIYRHICSKIQIIKLPLNTNAHKRKETIKGY